MNRTGLQKLADVPQYGRWQAVFAGTGVVDSVRLTGPDGCQCLRPVFQHQPANRAYDRHGYESITPTSAPVYAARFSPSLPGAWRCAWLRGSTVVQEDRFGCVPDGHPGYVEISRHDPRYFSFTNGQPYVAIGLNLCVPPRFALAKGGEFERSEQFATLGVREYERWFQLLAANGGNYARLWLSALGFAVEGAAAGQLDLLTFTRLDAVVAAARHRGIRLKLCLEHFRRVTAGSGPDFFRRELHDPQTMAQPANMDDWFHNPLWQQLWWQKIDAYLARYGDDPVVMAWELWNEIDCCQTSAWAIQRDWTEKTLRAIKHRSPRNLVTNSLGSFDYDDKQVGQDDFKMAAMDFQQVHRYLDQGAGLTCCQTDPVAMSVDAVQRARRSDRPIILTETGAVDDCHTGPFRYYRWDDAGLIFHDTTYPAWFAGAAGSGHIWHWDVYVDQKNLWPGFRALADAIRGVAVDREEFTAVDLSTPACWCLALRGRTVTLAWIRNRTDRWDLVLRDGQPPVRLTDISFDLCAAGQTPQTVRLFRPWPQDGLGEPILLENRVSLPAFQHGLVMRIDHPIQE